MKKNGVSRCISLILTLCIMLTCVSFSFGTASAAEVADDSSTSLSATAAGSLVEEDGFTWDNATVYFLLTDRFKNGNTSNDHSYGRATDASGNALSGWDTNPGTFHGGDFAGITQTIEEGYFDDLGINALWISAPYEQIHGYCDSGQGFAHYSYHGYYVLDYTEADANFGTKEEFETLVDTAHEHGIRVVMDIVMNHAGYNTVKDMEEFNFGTLLSGASDFKYMLTGVGDVNNHIDFSSSASDWGRWWSNDWIRSGLPGYTEEQGNDYVNSLSGLPDFRTEQTKSVSIPPILKTKWTQEGTYNEKLAKYGSSNTVTGYISTWLSEWVKEYGVDGFRCDTAKHVENASWNQLKTACVSALKTWRQNNPDKPGAEWKEDFWMTGEAWDHGVGYDAYYSEGGFDSMINFSTCGGGALASSSVANVYQGYADQINTKEGFNALSFISSHDEVLTRGDEKTMIYNGSAFLLLPGAVQLFYGDESNRPMYQGLSFDGYGGSGHSLRSDMNWDSINTTVLEHWQKVGTFRNDHVAVGAGANTKLTASNGVAFGRTYDKNGVTDKIAAVIGCNSNKDVTVDVSSIWSDGQYLVNTYDQSSALVSGGKVTFNSGENGTILIQEPDGRPLVSVKGNSKFVGTQTVTVSLEECDTAKCSIDGGNKFIVKNGTTFTIGDTAYDGDTIKVTLEAENDKGTSSSSFNFVKVAAGDAQDTTGETTPVEKAKLVVKTWDDSAPYAYVWTGTNTAVLGDWPGTKLTAKDSDGNYYVELDTTDTYNVVLNNGSGAQSSDITGLNGTATVEVTDSSYNAKLVSNGSSSGGSTGGDATDSSVTIRVKSYDGSAPNLYVWDDNDKSILGAWPGTQLSEKDSDGNYIVTIENKSSVNAIVNNGSGQTGDITDISGDVLIQITDAQCSAYKLTVNEVPLSGMALLRKEAREVKAMTSSDYTADSWSAVSNAMLVADGLIAQGDAADEAAVQTAAEQLQAAKAGLKLATPTLSYAVIGQSTIKGYTAPEANVTVTVGSSTYTAVADDVTGAYEVTASTLARTSTVKVSAERNGISSGTLTYSMTSGNITNGTTPTQPTTSVQPTTAQLTTATPTTPQPTTAQPTTQATTATTDKSLTVKSTSNFFPTTTQRFDADTDTVTVTYYLKSDKSLLDSQWILTYDPSVLQYNDDKNSNVSECMPCVSRGSYTNPYPTTPEGALIPGMICGNSTNIKLDSLKTSDGKEVAFVTVTFDVLSYGNTTVDLEVEVLTISDAKSNDESVVNNSVVCDYTTPVTATTKIYEGLYTGEVEDGVEITATSNFFPTFTQKFDADTDTVTVTYYINSAKSMLNNEWVLTFDSSVLQYNESKNTKVDDFMPCVISGGYSNISNSSTIKGNSTSLKLNSLSSADGSKVGYVSVTFDVVGTGKTEVNLLVKEFTVANLNASGTRVDSTTEESIVLNSVVQSYTTKITTDTLVYEGEYGNTSEYMYGDINLDGQITVKDATLLQKYLADSESLSELQLTLADVTVDGKITIKDATAIQKFVAGIETIGRTTGLPYED